MSVYPGDTAVTAVIPYKPRPGHPSIKLCLESLRAQTLKPRIHVVHVPRGMEWNVSRARNRGIRAVDSEYVVVVDADLILEENVIENIVELHETFSDVYITSSVRMMRKWIDVELPRDLPLLREKPFIYSMGWGGIYSAPREWWFKVRGFDERLDHLMMEDIDMRDRAVADGRKWIRLNEFVLGFPNFEIYHQYHEPAYEALSLREKATILERRTKFKDSSIVRNDSSWGLLPS